MIAEAASEVRALASSDRSTWGRFRFAQMAENITDRVDNPAESGVDRYVGLEHLAPESLQIRRWGVPTDVEATKLRFQPGDIIFGKRRAYQRKLAVADFEGICSAHALVLRARPEVVSPDFLPFFMQSETFFERALAISVGSLSPTINWRTLAAQEFALPPLEEQRRIAEVLWAVDAACTQAFSVVDALQFARNTWFDSVIAEGLRETENESGTWQSVPLQELWTRSPRNGFSAHPVDRETGVYVLALSSLSAEGYQPGELKSVEDETAVSDSRLKTGDLLISRSNTIDRVGFAGVFDENRCDVSYPDTMMRLEVDEERLQKRFLERVILSEYGRTYMRSIAAGTSSSMKKINRTGLGAMTIPLPDLTLQNTLVAHDQQFVRATETGKERNLAVLSLRKHLVNSLIQNELLGDAADVQ